MFYMFTVILAPWPSFKINGLSVKSKADVGSGRGS